jgi:hypothetical protein
MMRNVNDIANTLFQKSNFNELTQEEVLDFHEKYPFSSIGSYLYLQKLKLSNANQFEQEFAHTSLYFNNQQWLQHILQDDGTLSFQKLNDFTNQSVDDHSKNGIIEKEQIELTQLQDKQPTTETEIADQGNSSSEFAFEPYHTIDYFASQGIKLSQIESSDQLGQKVKSFTAWLKTMKKLQAEEANKPTTQETENIVPLVNIIVNGQIDNSTVITVSMAEVYAKQGLTQKAIDIYNKLSLQNPDNSHIFADRIKALKEKKP